MRSMIDFKRIKQKEIKYCTHCEFMSKWKVMVVYAHNVKIRLTCAIVKLSRLKILKLEFYWAPWL